MKIKGSIDELLQCECLLVLMGYDSSDSWNDEVFIRNYILNHIYVYESKRIEYYQNSLITGCLSASKFLETEELCIF